MRVLFSSVPAPSHIGPMLPLARALAVDHEVVFATGKPLVGMVDRAGVRGLAAGPEWSEPQAEKAFPELADVPLEDKAMWWYDELFLDRAGRPMARDLTAWLQTESADVVVRSQLEFGGWAAAQAHGLPQLVIGLGGTHRVQDLPEMQERLAGLLTAADAPGPIDGRSTFGDHFALLHPEHYDDWVPPVPWTRWRPPVAMPAGTRPAPPAILDGARGRPVILVTFGTVFNRTPGIFEPVLEALATLDVFGVVTVGGTGDPSQFDVPDNVVVRQFVSYDALLPHCDAVVCHGGFGTVMTALAHGLPMVIVPLSADQPGHAASCRDLGVAEATTLDAATAPWIRRSITRILDNPSFRAAARRFGEDLMAMRPIESATSLVEGLA